MSRILTTTFLSVALSAAAQQAPPIFPGAQSPLYLDSTRLYPALNTTNAPGSTIITTNLYATNAYFTTAYATNLHATTSDTTNLTVYGSVTNLNLNPNALVISDVNKQETSLPNGTGALTNNGSGVLGWDRGLTDNLWTNSNGNIGLITAPVQGKILYLGPYGGSSGSNTMKSLIKTYSGNPALADANTFIAEYAGTGNIPSCVYTELDPPSVSGLACVEGQTYAYFCINKTTNADFVDWIYNGDATVGTLGQTATTTANNGGAAIGTVGFVSTKGPMQAGISGYVPSTVNNQTNIGGVFTSSVNGKTGGAHIGAYAELRSAAPGDGTPLDLVNSVILADNRDSALPLMTLRSNGVPIIQADANGNLAAGAKVTAWNLTITNQIAYLPKTWSGPTNALDLSLTTGAEEWSYSTVTPVNISGIAKDAGYVERGVLGVTNAASTNITITVVAGIRLPTSDTQAGSYTVTNGDFAEVLVEFRNGITNAVIRTWH